MVLFLCLAFKAQSTGYVYEYDDNCLKAYNSFMSLHLSEGRSIIDEELRVKPNNLMAAYIADYEDCLLLLMNGDAAEYERKRERMAARLNLIEKGDRSSPWYRTCKAGIYLHRAFIDLRMGENLKAAIAFRKSYILAGENEKEHPGLASNAIFTGLQSALVGTIPASYKWIASILGMKGDVRKGIGALTAFVGTHNYNDPMYYEALLYTLYLRYYLYSKQDEVWHFVTSEKFPVQNNIMNAFVRANISISYRKAEVAIQALKTVENTPDYKLFPAFDFEMGTALFFKTDPSCINYFQRFVKNYKGGRFVKDAWQQMALIYYLQGSIRDAERCRAQIDKEGSEDVDADKQAQHFAERKDWPDANLLRARMLIDGGYYEEALKQLAAINPQQLKVEADKVEYLFRLGRAYDEKGDNDKAVYYYQSTINAGRERPEYFAARAALQMGYLYEHNSKLNAALSSYREALSMRDHDFQSSIDQQAKAGINRLSAK